LVSALVSLLSTPLTLLPFQGLIEMVTTIEDGFLRSQWESCFIFSFLLARTLIFSTNEAENINGKRKIRTFLASVA
jgi:hypothetical protein